MSALVDSYRAGFAKASAITLDIAKGDTLLGGRFKNMKTVVETIGTDELGQPTVNGKKLLSFRIAKAMPEKASQYAPGLPRKGHYGDPLRGLRSGQLAMFALQQHDTDRRPGRPHYDLRIGSPESGLYSWAVPKAQLPEPGHRLLAVQTEIHSPSYGSFSGRIGKGYGAGTVKSLKNGKVLVTEVGDNRISFTVPEGKSQVRYVLVRTGSDRNWLLVAGTPPRDDIPGVGLKPSFKRIQADDLDAALEQAVEVQAKIDGASGVIDIGPDGRVEAYSVRRGVNGAPIVHTERMGLTALKLPALSNTTMRAELYGTRHGKAIPFTEISAILNSAVDKAVARTRKGGITMKAAPFELLRSGGRLVEGDANAELARVVSALPHARFKVPERAAGAAMRGLIDRIRAGTQADTSEGVIVRTPEGRAKYVFNEEATGRLRDVFPGGGSLRAAGGLLVDVDGSPDPVRLGTGFSREDMDDIIANMALYKDRPVRIGYRQRFSSGALRAPVFLGFETDK